MKFARIRPGEFVIGTTKGDVDKIMQFFPNHKQEFLSDERPEHSVPISEFYLGIHEVTEGQYRTVMGKAPSHFEGSDLPAEHVSWLEAVEFCNKLSQREARRPYYRIQGKLVTFGSGNGYRLPTEAEWEYACRAGARTIYPFGDDPGELGEYTWYESNSFGTRHPVGQKWPNVWGLRDMLGNVLEWCADLYDENNFAFPQANNNQTAALASRRVFRGGGYENPPYYCRSACRRGTTPDYRSSDVGFRVAADLE